MNTMVVPKQSPLTDICVGREVFVGDMVSDGGWRKRPERLCRFLDRQYRAWGQSLDNTEFSGMVVIDDLT